MTQLSFGEQILQNAKDVTRMREIITKTHQAIVDQQCDLTLTEEDWKEMSEISGIPHPYVPSAEKELERLDRWAQEILEDMKRNDPPETQHPSLEDMIPGHFEEWAESHRDITDDPRMKDPDYREGLRNEWYG